ncbi:two-component system, NtrC family, response regulator [Evansella caseinilytica]|uniref:Two-component system, NtrC family, response regulator n=1 Tax=Evansella caseinilytica TaxID=1503961 RepID=A0A1H3II72_9BACI|nr:sigma-54 dependent transcriptional regulator [Evansella caseinilytica]SDY26534.1 two-component system, NtrC family, response regulator [Evansella caseinilytica]
MFQLLIVDDEIEVCNFLKYLFEAKGCLVMTATTKTVAEQCLHSDTRFQLALIDLKLPDTNGLEILQETRKMQPQCKAVIMTGYSTIQSAVDAIKLGAADYIEKPFDNIDDLEQLVDHLLTKKPEEEDKHIADAARQAGLILGNNQRMKDLIYTAGKIAGKNLNVLIEGETGTGKEVLSRFIHAASRKEKEAFFGVNCGAISESLLESELFGHEKGAFTGATQERKGLFELASNGTLFLDEIAEASPAIQVKLLRVLETREFMRVGGERFLHTHSRIIAATNEDLTKAVSQKKFRQDLFYRLNVVSLKIPPLRERKDDIPTFVSSFLAKQSRDITLSDAAMAKLMNYDWPGNLRELFNVLTRALMLSDDAHQPLLIEDISFEDGMPIPSALQPARPKTSTELGDILRQSKEQILALAQQDEDIYLEDILQEIRELENDVGRAFIRSKLKETLGDRREAARMLNISIRKLRYLLNEK